MKTSFLHPRLLAAIALSLGLGACGGGSNVTNVNLGGTVAGLSAGSLVLTNSSSSVTLTPGTPSFTFGTRVNVGTSYGVAVQTQPAGLTCSIANATGIAGTDDISNVQVTCVQNNSLGGSISGLTAAGLVLANGSDTVSPAANATTFTFPTRVGDGSAYGVTVLAQPAGLTCSVANGAAIMGAADVTSVQVNCI